MKVSKINRREAKALFNACRVNGVLDDSRVRDAVARVIDQKPRAYVGLLHHFQRLVALDVQRRTATVESAVPLPTPVQQQLAAGLSARHGGGLSLVHVVNPALIGGLRIRVGSDVYDASVATRLQSLVDSV